VVDRRLGGAKSGEMKKGFFTTGTSGWMKMRFLPFEDSHGEEVRLSEQQ
jgi:hypothetical protein